MVENPLQSYRFVIDDNTQRENCITTWERTEKNSLKAMFDAYILVIKFVLTDIPLNTDFIKNLHSLAMTNVSNTLYTEHGGTPGNYKNFITSVSLIAGLNVTAPGFLEMQRCEKLLLQHYRNNITNGFLGKTTPAQMRQIFFKQAGWKNLLLTFHADIELHLENIIKIYNNDIQHPHDQEQKLAAIVECVQKLTWAHPFSDGNCRTFCVLLLNALLLREKLPPTVLKFPSVFDGFSKEELIVEVKNGQFNAKKIFKHSKVGFALTKVDKKILFTSSKNFYNYLAKLSIIFDQNCRVSLSLVRRYNFDKRLCFFYGINFIKNSCDLKSLVKYHEKTDYFDFLKCFVKNNKSLRQCCYALALVPHKHLRLLLKYLPSFKTYKCSDLILLFKFFTDVQKINFLLKIHHKIISNKALGSLIWQIPKDYRLATAILLINLITDIATYTKIKLILPHDKRHLLKKYVEFTSDDHKISKNNSYNFSAN